MNLHNKPKIISAYRGMYKYIESVRNNSGSDLKKLWDEHVIEPYWYEWAAGTSVEERTREQLKYPITNINELESEVELLSSSAIEEIAENAYKRAYTNLPKYGEVVICIYALDPDNITVSEKQNGVVGTCIDGNILIQINPKVPNWKEWVSYVIAHEYHHSVWGYNYFYLRGNTRMDLLTGLIIDGQADSFAKKLYPDLNPSWLNALSEEQELEQWEIMQQFLDSGDGAVYCRFFFGDAATNTPWCTAYTIGFHIVQSYLKLHSNTDINELMNIDPYLILSESKYNGRPASIKPF